MSKAITKEKFEKLIKKCLEKFCDNEVSDTTENVDPDGYNKIRTVIWYYKPYTFIARYLFSEKAPNFAPLGLTARLDSDTEEQELRTTEGLVEKIGKANLMREAGMV